MGFDQAKNIREYRFDGVGAGEAAKHFVVSADLALFIKYRVGLQEGPALCLKRLSADLETLQQLPHELTQRGSGRPRIGSSCCGRAKKQLAKVAECTKY